MADFCSECSTEMFGEDTKDLADLTTEDQTKQGLYCVAICESCGVIQVDHAGVRVTPKE